MADVHQLSRTDARRIAVRAQLLSAERPTAVVDTVRHLTLVQLEPTNAIVPSADLVLWSRIGSAYEPQDLLDALDQQRLVDFWGAARAAEDMRLFRAEMEQWPGAGEQKDWQRRQTAWIEANGECHQDLLERLRGDGPLPASALPDSCVEPWPSSGWNNNRNVRMMLELMVARGEVAVAGREGRERLWDLAERIYPDDAPVPVDEALRLRDEGRLRGLGIARARAAKTPNEPHSVGEAGELAVIEGVKGRWRVDPAQLGQPFEGRTALLSPLDRLVFDRRRMDEVFEYDYALEMYKPAAQRIWGYYALPVLHGDRLVGKLDARADRDAGVLQVHALHEDEPFPKAMRAAVDREVRELASWLGLDLSLPR